MRRDGWTGGVLALGLVVAMIGILLPSLAHAQKNVTSLFDVRVGGYVQMNVTWDSDENPDDNPSSMRKFATTKGSAQDGRDTLRWAATRTRLFMDIRGPDVWGAKSRAYTEFDWDGLKLGETSGTVSATAANTPRLRRAYFRFDWPSAYLLIGQETLIFDSVVGSASEVEGVSSGHGDITAGSRNRAPSIIVGSVIPMMGASLELVGSVARHATDNQPDAGINDSGARSDKPAVEALVKATVQLFGRNALFAGSYYWGEEKLTSTTSPAEKNVNSTGLALEALVPVGPVTPFGAFDVRGSWFTADNMSRWNLGNNGLTTSNPTLNPQEISAKGYWVEGNWEINKNFAVGTGFGHVEDDKGDVISIGGTTPRVLDNDAWWLFGTYREGPFMFLLQYSNVNKTTRIVPATGVETDTSSQEVHFIFRYTF